MIKLTNKKDREKYFALLDYNENLKYMWTFRYINKDGDLMDTSRNPKNIFLFLFKINKIISVDEKTEYQL